MEIGFSVNLRDEDGDVYDTCVLLHFDDNLILRFKNYNEFSRFVDEVNRIKPEVRSYWDVCNEDELFL